MCSKAADGHSRQENNCFGKHRNEESIGQERVLVVLLQRKVSLTATCNDKEKQTTAHQTVQDT